MYRLLIISLMTVMGTQVMATEEPPSLENLSLNKLEQKLAETQDELDQLANYSMRTGIGTAGHRSKPHPDPDHTEWITISLQGHPLIDQIILTPIIRRDTKRGLHADGFPLTFKIIAGTKECPEGTTIASYTTADQLLPRIAPVVIHFPPCTASWVKLEATELSARDWDHQYILQLSEIMIFSGPENLALHRPVRVSSCKGNLIPSRSVKTLVDGQVPYLMDAATGKSSIAFMSFIEDVKLPALTIDLEQAQTINRVHLHTAELSDTIPQSANPAAGIPVYFQIEGAEKSDFSDAKQLTEYRRNNIFEASPIIMKRFPKTRCRYIRLNIKEPYQDKGYYTFGCAELELFSKGENVALGKNATLNYAFNTEVRSLTSITDGRNLYGNILPIRGWMEQLARRHDLETQQPMIQAEITKRYATQRKILKLVSGLAGLLVLAIGFTILITRHLQMRQIERLKTRFAADLHDELGANLHAIGLLGDIAKEAIHSPEILVKAVDKMRALTERSGEAARYCSELQEADIFGKLPDDMQRTANRMMNDIEYTISIEGEELLEALPPRTQADLFLFYKESLVNISRHSGADKVQIQLHAHQKIKLMISDNGQGLSGHVPASLKRRARLLGGQLSIKESSEGGTYIRLTFIPRKSIFKKQKALS